MLDFLRSYQLYLLLGGGFFCLLIAFFLMAISFQSIQKKKALFRFELGVSILLFMNSLSLIFQGGEGSVIKGILYSSAFFSMLFSNINIYLFNSYITSMFMEKGKFKTLPKRLKAVFVVSSINATLVVFSLIFKQYFYIDSANFLRRGSLYSVNSIILFCLMVVQAVFLIQYRKMVHISLFHILLLNTILPVLGNVMELIYPEISCIALFVMLGAVLIFWCELAVLNSDLIKAANTERVTGLPNTYGFMYEIDRIKHSGDITAYDAYYFDIVRMSQINDKYGKTAGDQLILKYALYIREHIEKEEIVGRLGGNFFVALIKKENSKNFQKMLEDIPIVVDSHGREAEVHVAAIAGGYHIDKKTLAPGQILGFVSMAVTYAKNVVKKKVLFMDQDLENEITQNRRIEENAIQGLKNKEFIPYYQPKVDTKNNELCGAEALVRWRHDDELVPPMKFVPIMEKNGSVCDLDFYMLHQVCQDISSWLEQGMNVVPVSVNFSRKNLGNPILAEAIANVVKEYGVPPELVQIEITETIDEFPLSYLKGVVEALHRYGLSTAIDDFGTGSSSINLLKEVTFDVLKIDRAFVHYKDEKESQLLSSIIQMSNAIGLDVIAEGVEYTNEVDQLKSMGCEKIQGYVFDRPLEKSKFEERLKQHIYS